jgi:hypothetical protein
MRKPMTCEMMPSSFHRIRTTEAHRQARSPARDCPIESQPVRSAIPVALGRESDQAEPKADPSKWKSGSFGRDVLVNNGRWRYINW